MSGSAGEVRIDLHVHTRHSHDSAAPVDSVLQRCRDSGLGLVAVTDHDNIRGGLEAREKSNGFPVIVGEEIKTAEGDVIGLFLEDPVPPRLTPLETVKRVKDQGGLVGVPHPFDRVRPTAMGRRALLEILPWVDFLEGYNAHTLLSRDNRRGVDFAEEYTVPVVACSDSHSALELGRTYTGVTGEELDGTPEGLMRAIRSGVCVGRRPNPLLMLAPAYAKLRKLLG
jgi:predicted metal-dependent phosphoesterase TrpH